MGKLRNILFGAPLHVAASKGDIAAVKKLLKTGVDVNERDSFGANALFYAAGHGKEDLVAFLLDKGADVNVQKNDGMSPLIASAASGHSSVVRLLIERGADLKAMDNSGQTALDFARTVSGDKTTIDNLSNATECAPGALPPKPAEPPAGTSTNATSVTPQESQQFRERFRIERVAFIAITAIIAGAIGGSSTDLGPFGLMLMVGGLMVGFYATAKTLLGIGGFSETVRVGAKIAAFDWKRFLLDPLCFGGVFLALLLLTGLIALFKWAFSGGK